MLHYLALRGTLEQRQSKSLLIFDGLDDEESWGYVLEQMPRRGRTTVLVSSRLRGFAIGSDFCQLSLTDLSKDAAVDFLLKAVDGRDTNREQAEILAEMLCHLPLAIGHAAAFIKFTREYTFSKCIKALKSTGVALLGPAYIPRQRVLQHTILTTWNKSVDVACQGSDGALVADLLRLFSLLAEAPIPFGFIEQLKNLDSEDLLTATQRLTNCSLLEDLGDTYTLHGLLRKVISNAISESDKQYYLCQALHILYDLTKNLDMEDPQTRRHLDPYVPHLEGLIASAQTIPSVHSDQVESLLDRLFFYYVGDRKSDSYKRIGEMYLKHLKQQKPDALGAVYHQKIEIVLSHLNHEE